VRDITETTDFSAMLDFLKDQEFAYIDEHKDILDWSIGFKFINKDKTLGYVWLYALAEEDNNYLTHMCIDKKYQGRVLTKHIVNKFYSLAYGYGADVLKAEQINKKLINLYKRIGWQKTSENSCEIKLPYLWRTQHGSS